MENQTVQKLLIGCACLGFGAGAHLLFSGKSAPPPEQVAIEAPRVRPQTVTEPKRQKERPTATRPAPVEAEARPEPEKLVSPKRTREKPAIKKLRSKDLIAS